MSSSKPPAAPSSIGRTVRRAENRVGGNHRRGLSLRIEISFSASLDRRNGLKLEWSVRGRVREKKCHDEERDRTERERVPGVRPLVLVVEHTELNGTGDRNSTPGRVDGQRNARGMAIRTRLLGTITLSLCLPILVLPALSLSLSLSGFKNDVTPTRCNHSGLNVARCQNSAARDPYDPRNIGASSKESRLVWKNFGGFFFGWPRVFFPR